MSDQKVKGKGVVRLGCVRSSEYGFTLPELLVVLAIMVIFLLAVGQMISSGARSSSATYGLVQIQDAANEALSTILRQLRGAVSIGLGTTASYIHFAADLDGDGDWEAAAFDAQNGYLRRWVGELDQEPQFEDWIESCSDLRFRFYRYNEATGRLEEVVPGSSEWLAGGFLEVKKVEVEMTFRRGALGGAEMERSFSGNVTLRNRLQDIL